VTSPYFTEARAEQRRHELRMGAQAASIARRARAARAAQRSGAASTDRRSGDPVALGDGSTVLVRDLLRQREEEAIEAVDPLDGRGVGVARYVRTVESGSADLGLIVVDGWRRRGVGTLLLSRLTCRARDHGVFAFTASVPAHDEAMIALLRNAKAGVELVHISPSTLEYEISLAAFERSLPACP
jgi:GNAT superfamily N-acetyltransferase